MALASSSAFAGTHLPMLRSGRGRRRRETRGRMPQRLLPGGGYRLELHRGPRSSVDDSEL